MRFPSVVQEKLESMGWYPGRTAQDLLISWIGQLVTKRGLEIFDEARIALLEFGGLKYIGTDTYGGRHVNLEFNPLLVDGTCEDFFGYKKFFNEALFPLGEMFDSTAYLLISESGRIYYIVPDDVIFTGERIEGFLEAMWAGKKIKEIATPMALIFPNEYI